MSKVVSNGNGYIKFPINEPAQGKRNPDWRIFRFYGGTRCTTHCCGHGWYSVSPFLNSGSVVWISLRAETTARETMQRVGKINEEINDLKKLNIWWIAMKKAICFRFSPNPFKNRPTLSLKSLNAMVLNLPEKNFKALFESINAEQALQWKL